MFICCSADIQDPPWEVSHRLENILLGDNIKTNFRENGCERCTPNLIGAVYGSCG
jgi:hypothetical protein